VHRALLITGMALLSRSAAAQASLEEAVGPDLLAAARISALPKAERAAWSEYIARSAVDHAGDTAAFNAELHNAPLVKAPYSAPDFRFGERSSAWLESDSGRTLATSVLTWQTKSGGWSKRTDMWKPRERGMTFYSETESWHYTPTFDNGATTGQLRFLAGMVNATGMPAYADAFGRGLDLIVRAQQPNGCWPQTYPLEGGYHDAATFNDDVAVLILRLLDDVAAGTWAFASPAQKSRAKVTAARGLECLLHAQVKVNGALTVWGQQHDPLSLAIVPARKYELAGLAGRESASIMMYLMSLPAPSAAVVRAVNGAATWFQSHSIRGLRYEHYELTKDQSAPPLWPRLTEISTNRPIFANRDAVKLYDWNKLTDRRSGYGWFGTEPSQALERYKLWSQTHRRAQ